MLRSIVIIFCHLLTCTLILADPLQQTLLSDDKPKDIYKIAIIGAGPAGSSTAYHISQFASDLHPNVKFDLTVFEQNSYVGGRTTTVNALNDPRYPIELGASIFVKLNKILYQATRDFNLPTSDRFYESTGSKYDLGIWDGEQFVLTTSSYDNDGRWKRRWNGLWDIAKLLWRYGLSPVKLQNLQKSVIGRFLTIYDEPVFPFDLTKAAKAADLLPVTGVTGAQLLDNSGIYAQFQREVIQASTRVNYAQNLNQIHGLETLVSMSAEGAMAVQGGNWQIFKHMLDRSGADVRLNTSIASISVEHNGSVTVGSRQTNREEMTILNDENFDAVIIAAPMFNNRIDITPEPHARIFNNTDYVPLYVTLFSSPYRPSPSFFQTSDSHSEMDIPDSVLTTLPDFLSPGDLDRGEQSVGPTTFWSLSTLRVLRPSTDGFDVPTYLDEGHIPVESLGMKGRHYVYKIFSPWRFDAADLISILDLEHKHPFAADPAFDAGDYVGKNISQLPREAISWSYEKLWESYPYLPPKTEFGCFDLYHCRDAPVPKSVAPGKVWYTSVMEEFISTMETSALAGKNVARLLVDQIRTGSGSA